VPNPVSQGLSKRTINFPLEFSKLTFSFTRLFDRMHRSCAGIAVLREGHPISKFTCLNRKKKGILRDTLRQDLIQTHEWKIMSKVFVNIGLSLDGYMAPEGMTMENPGYKNWGAKWGALMAWLINLQYFRESLKFGPGGETGPVNDMVRDTTERIGANIMGKRMFDQGERAWPEDAPFHTPVYVLTNEKREPWVRPGGTTFYFINNGPEHALELARESAGNRDIRIAGGADVIQQYLNLGAIDELEIALAPVLFGRGRRLFENLREPGPQFRIDKVLDDPAATHLRYVRL
jgi:dihydrofolate reductase